MANFVEAKFQYLVTFERFGWMSYLTTQFPVHENLLKVLFSNAILENESEEEEDLCRMMEINTFVMGRPIWITQEDVAITFDMPD